LPIDAAIPPIHKSPLQSAQRLAQVPPSPTFTARVQHLASKGIFSDEILRDHLRFGATACINPHWLKLHPSSETPALFSISIDANTMDPIETFVRLSDELATLPSAIPVDPSTGRATQTQTFSPLTAALAPLTPASLDPDSSAPQGFFKACSSFSLGHHNVKRKALFICGVIGTSPRLTSNCERRSHDDCSPRAICCSNVYQDNNPHSPRSG
jgi:hypothetical protein